MSERQVTVTLDRNEAEAHLGVGPITPETPCRCGATAPAHYCPLDASARAKLRTALQEDDGETAGELCDSCDAPLPPDEDDIHIYEGHKVCERCWTGGEGRLVSRESAKLVMEDAYRMKVAYERVCAELTELRAALTESTSSPRTEGA